MIARPSECENFLLMGSPGNPQVRVVLGQGSPGKPGKAGSLGSPGPVAGVVHRAGSPTATRASPGVIAVASRARRAEKIKKMKKAGVGPGYTPVHARYPAPVPAVSVRHGTFGTVSTGTLAAGTVTSLVAGLEARLLRSRRCQV